MNAPAAISPTTSPANVCSQPPSYSTCSRAKQRATSSASRSIFIAARSRSEVHSASSPSPAARGARSPATDGGEQRAVAHEIGVAADRRGEVAVVRRPEAGMAAVLRRVGGLLEGAQDQRGQRRATPARGSTRTAHVRLDAPGDLPHQLGRLRRRHVLRQAAASGPSSEDSWSTRRFTRSGSGRSCTRYRARRPAL